MSLKIPQERLLSHTKVETLRCIICHEITLFPSECLHCQNLFCSACFSTWKNIRNVCPLQCKGDFQIKPIHTRLKEIILSLQIACNNKPIGCLYTGNIVNVLIHEKKSCEYNKIKCPNGGCQAFVMKKELENHKKNCPYAVFTCQFCKIVSNKLANDHDCFTELKNNVERLQKKQQESSIIIQNLHQSLNRIKEEREGEKECETLMERSLTSHCKDLKNIIRKQITKEVNKKKDKLMKLDSGSLVVAVDFEGSYHKGFCCEKEVNLQWNTEKIVRQCGLCNKPNSEIRYFCKVCQNNLCVKCKPILICYGKCPIAHKLNKLTSKSLVSCSKCGIIVGANQSHWNDKNCQLMLCEKCFKQLNKVKKDKVLLL